MPVSYEFSADCVGKSAVTRCQNSLYLTGECPTTLAPNYHKDAYPITYDGDGVKVSAILQATTNGEIEKETDSLEVESTLKILNATEVTLCFCAVTSFVSFDKLPNKETFYACIDKMDKLSKVEYETIKDAHTKDVNELYNRVKTDFGGKPSNLDTDERLKSENKDLGLCELLYNFGRYLIISASREGSQATNLQGIWNDSFYAPWSSNYTLNINAEIEG